MKNKIKNSPFYIKKYSLLNAINGVEGGQQNEETSNSKG